MKLRVLSIWLLVFLFGGSSYASSFKKFGGGGSEGKPVVIWEFKGSTSQTTAAASLTFNVWNKFDYASADQNEAQDVNNEWKHSDTEADYVELCFEPADGITRKFHIEMWFTFLQNITAAQQPFWLTVGYSEDGEGVTASDAGAGLYYQFTGMNDNTYTTVTVERTFSIVSDGCIAPLVWPDDTVDLVTTAGQIVITEMEE